MLTNFWYSSLFWLICLFNSISWSLHDRNLALKYLYAFSYPNLFPTFNKICINSTALLDFNCWSIYSSIESKDTDCADSTFCSSLDSFPGLIFGVLVNDFSIICSSSFTFCADFNFSNFFNSEKYCLNNITLSLGILYFWPFVWSTNIWILAGLSPLQLSCNSLIFDFNSFILLSISEFVLDCSICSDFSWLYSVLSFWSFILLSITVLASVFIFFNSFIRDSNDFINCPFWKFPFKVLNLPNISDKFTYIVI